MLGLQKLSPDVRPPPGASEGQYCSLTHRKQSEFWGIQSFGRRWRTRIISAHGSAAATKQRRHGLEGEGTGIEAVIQRFPLHRQGNGSAWPGARGIRADGGGGGIVAQIIDEDPPARFRLGILVKYRAGASAAISAEAAWKRPWRRASLSPARRARRRGALASGGLHELSRPIARSRSRTS
jgi:hypothetical protein